MLYWGIVGASKIANNFCATLNTARHEIVAIASRSHEAAELFATKNRISQIYDSYEGLAADPKVQIVYISVLNPQHYDVAMLMLENRKHVVCEKPLTMTHWQTCNLIALAQRQNRFLMEGLWSRFFPVYQHLSTVLDVLRPADIRELYVKHGYLINVKTFVHKCWGGGVTLNIASYAIQLMLFVFRDEPKTIRASGKVNANGVDLYCEVEFTFSANRRAHIVCSSLERLENSATIITTKGPICIPLYWRPSMYIALGKMHEWPTLTLPLSTDTVDDFYYHTNATGLKRGADEIAKYIELGSVTCPIVGHEESKRISKIQDEIRKQLGVHYDCDKKL